MRPNSFIARRFTRGGRGNAHGFDGVSTKGGLGRGLTGGGPGAGRTSMGGGRGATWLAIGGLGAAGAACGGRGAGGALG